MSTRALAWFQIPIILILAGCSGLQHATETEYVPVIDCGSGLISNLEQMHATRGLSEDQARMVLAVHEREYLESPSFNNRMILVLLLATGDVAIQDRERALGLLQGIDSMSLSTVEQEFLLIIRRFLDDLAESRTRLENLSGQLREQDGQIEELRQQLRELTTIEQSMQRRDKSLEIEGGE